MMKKMQALDIDELKADGDELFVGLALFIDTSLFGVYASLSSMAIASRWQKTW